MLANMPEACDFNFSKEGNWIQSAHHCGYFTESFIIILVTGAIVYERECCDSTEEPGRVVFLKAIENDRLSATTVSSQKYLII